MAITNHRIENIGTFITATDAPRQLAGLYNFYMLDFLIELAYKVSSDFYDRPHLYTNLGDPIIVRKIARLHARNGTDEGFPSYEQRAALYAPIFGSLGGSMNDFAQLRDELIQAAIAFTERLFDTSEDTLRQRVRIAHRSFRNFLDGLQGETVAFNREVLLRLTDVTPSGSALSEGFTYPILRNAGVAAVFRLPTPPAPQWPYREDANGNKLVEAISNELTGPNDPVGPVSREEFLNRQAVALRGTEALATVFELDPTIPTGNEADVDLLTAKVYTWGTLLPTLQPA